MRYLVPTSPTRQGADDVEGFFARGDGGRNGGVGGFVGKVLLEGEEADERATLPGGVVADRAAQHRIASFERVEDRALGHRAIERELHLAVDLGQVPKMIRQNDSDHDSLRRVTS